MLNVALPKGRLGEKAYEIMARAGYDCPELLAGGRKLTFENETEDILLEYAPEVYELMDLGIGKCRMCVAGFQDFRDDGDRDLRVATKFPRIAKAHYAEKGRDITIIKLNGSIEIAPLLGLSDVIVDIVETGKTLKENGLAPLETVAEISARFIANTASYAFHYDEIRTMCEHIGEIL